MKVVKFILRVISLLYVITLVLPTVILYLFFYTLFEFLNGFAYHNFLKEETPQAVEDVLANHNVHHPVLIRLIMMFISPPVKFLIRCKDSIKTIQF